MKELENAQEQFINEQLTVYTECGINGSDIANLETISTELVNTILTTHFTNAADMKAVQCLMETLFLQTSDGNKNNGLYLLTQKIKEFIKNIKSKDSKQLGVTGDIYFTDFFKDIPFVIKFAKKKDDNNSIIREYYIGTKALNNLRYIIPTFVYTFSSFSCSQLQSLCTSTLSDKIPYVLYEKIDGKVVKDEINSMSFEDWLVVFFQVLLSLEVAQRECRFTHFDLHASNIMLRKNTKVTYKVPIDMFTYEIVNPKFLPTIIDFDLASAHIDGHYIGSYAFTQHGMMKFMIPGYDMYKFLFASYANSFSNKKLRQEIFKLFSFYSTDDPYNITYNEREGSRIANDTYCGVISSSKAASYTPLMFMNWLVLKYKPILSKYIKIANRKHIDFITSSISIKTYRDIFNEKVTGIQDAIHKINECIKSHKASYITNMYLISLLRKQNVDLQSDDLNTKITEFNEILLRKKDEMISQDTSMLEKVFEINVCSQPLFDAHTKTLFDTRINPINRYKDFNRYSFSNFIEVIELMNPVLLFYEEIKPYMEMYFMILELNLETEFKDWLKRFQDSYMYKFYIRNISTIERAIRWIYSLKECLRIKELLSQPLDSSSF
jgi:hypothetical protein